MKNKLIRTALGLLAAIMCSAAVPPAVTELHAAGGVNDAKINEAVQASLLDDRAVPSFLIDAVTLDGIVALAGTVDNVLAKERALEITKSIAGVRAVVDRVNIAPPVRPDENIRRDVAKALQSNPATGAERLKVAVDAGMVTLRGAVRSRAEENLCVETAKGVRGVRRVDAKLRMEASGARTDPEIEEEIAARLEASVWIDASLVDVEVHEGIVTLSGVVGTEAEKTGAAVNAQVAGVRKVHSDDVDISRYLDDAYRRATAEEAPSSVEVKRAVEDALYFDPRVATGDIEVRVENGVATLQGTVPNPRAKTCAAEDARNTVGVRRVENQLCIREPANRSDSEIESDVISAIARDPYLHWLDVRASVIGGRVTLSGNVTTKFERRHAADLARNIPGIRGVENNITVGRHDASAADWKIRSAIQSGIYWNPLVESKHILVTVEKGVATLSGSVDTWQQYHVAREIALEEGARKVNNDLKVRGGMLLTPVT